MSRISAHESLSLRKGWSFGKLKGRICLLNLKLTLERSASSKLEGKLQVQGSKFQVAGFRFQVSGFLFFVFVAITGYGALGISREQAFIVHLFYNDLRKVFAECFQALRIVCSGLS